MKVNREQLLRVLESLEAGLANRETVEQSSCVAFSGGKAFTFNDEAMVRADDPLGGIFEGVVKAKTLLGILRKYGDDDLDVTADVGVLTVKAKGGKKTTMKSEAVLLPVGSVEEPKKWRKLPTEFGEAVGMVVKCAGNREDQFAMTCVHVAPGWVEAVDNQKMCRWTLDTGFKESVLLRRSGVKHVQTLGMEEVGETKGWVHFRNAAGMVLACRRYLDDFPDCGPWVKAEGVKASLPKGLVEAAQRAAVFSEENGKDEDYITVTLRPNKIRVRGVGVTGEYSEPKAVLYDGPEMEFLIRPAMLAELVNRHPECVVTHNSMRVDGGPWVYVTCLAEPDKKDRGDV